MASNYAPSEESIAKSIFQKSNGKSLFRADSDFCSHRNRFLRARRAHNSKKLKKIYTIPHFRSAGAAMKQVVVAKQKSTRINYANLAQLKEGTHNHFFVIYFYVLLSPIDQKEA